MLGGSAPTSRSEVVSPLSDLASTHTVDPRATETRMSPDADCIETCPETTASIR